MHTSEIGLALRSADRCGVGIGFWEIEMESTRFGIGLQTASELRHVRGNALDLAVPVPMSLAQTYVLDASSYRLVAFLYPITHSVDTRNTSPQQLVTC